MQVWVNIYDPTYSKIVANRLRPIRASYKRKLDEAGMGRASFAIDPRSLAEIKLRRVLEIWLSDVKLTRVGGAWEKLPQSRRLGAFVIESINPDPQARTITVRGVSFMSKLVDVITLPGLAYENQPVSTVLSALAGLAGWTVASEAALDSKLISVRFAGENVLRAIRFIAEAQGIHIRESDTPKQLEAGHFGAVNSQAVYVKGDAGEMALRREAPMLITSASISEESGEVVNKVFAYGGGDGDAALSLSLATHTRGFVDSEGAHGRTHYFVADSASIDLYGQIARRLDIKRITSTDASDVALQYASTALADAAKAWLDRHSMPYERLGLKVTNVNQSLMPGDKVHVSYQDVINLYGVPYQERDINEAYYLMATEQIVSDQGLDVGLEVANIDRYEQGAAEIVVGMMDSIEYNNVNIQPYPAPYYFPLSKAPIDTHTPYSSYFIVNTQTIQLSRAILYIFRSAWTAIASNAAAGGGSSVSSAAGGGSSVSSAGGGNHNHRMFSIGNITGFPGTSLRPYWGRNGNGGSLIGIKMDSAYNSDLWTESSSGTHTHTINIPAHTHSINIPAHTHDTEFSGVQVDDGANLLKDVTVKLDYMTVSTGLFPDGNTDTYAEIDITAALKGSPTMRGVHQITVSCNAGRGDIYAVAFVDVNMSRFRV